MNILLLSFVLTLVQVSVYCQDADFIQELAARVAALEKADHKQKLQLRKQQESLQLFQKKYDEQNVKLSLHEQRIKELEETVRVQQGIIKDHVIRDPEVGRVNELSDGGKSQDAHNVDIKATVPSKGVSPVHNLRDVRNYLSDPVRHLRFVGSSPETVAFHATIDPASDVTKLSIGQTIVFDSVHLNIGGAYHSSAGLFIAPTSGIYMFSVSVMHNNGGTSWISLALTQNGSILAHTYAYGYDQGSVSVVTQLKVGDEVLVRVRGPNDAMLYGEKFTSFTGVLLTQM